MKKTINFFSKTHKLDAIFPFFKVANKAKMECWCRMSRVCLVFVFLLVCCLFAETSVLAVSVSPPEENVWVEMAPMHYARSYFGTAVVDGKIYTIGGIEKEGMLGRPDPQHPLIVNGIEVYDPQTNRWTNRPSPMPTPRYRFAVVCFMDKIYCIGGRIYDRHGFAFTGVTEVYDPATNQWETKAPMTARGAKSACVINGNIYAMGSILIKGDEGTSYLDVCEVYDPLVDTWSVYDGPWPEEPSNSMVFDNRQYVWVGSRLRIYDFGLDSWMDGPDLPRVLYGRGVVEVDGLLYALGGCTETYSDPFNIWDPVCVSVRSCFVYTPFGYGRVAPEICVLSPVMGGVYDDGNVTLEFDTVQPVVWMGYSLDGQANVTVESSSTVLSDLSNGQHNVRMFAQDKYGNIGVSETISFTVINAPLSILFIAAAVTIFVVVLVIVGVCLFLFSRKRRRMKSLV